MPLNAATTPLQFNDFIKFFVAPSVLVYRCPWGGWIQSRFITGLDNSHSAYRTSFIQKIRILLQFPLLHVPEPLGKPSFLSNPRVLLYSLRGPIERISRDLLSSNSPRFNDLVTHSANPKNCSIFCVWVIISSLKEAKSHMNYCLRHNPLSKVILRKYILCCSF